MLSTPSEATVRVEKATSHLLIGPDWTMNLEICDTVNSNQWQAKDVIKSVKKRLQHKNPRVQFLALTLLETLIKNCGDFVHFQVVEREILQEMTKIVRKRTDMQVRDKILVLLDSWQEAFGGPQGKYPQYYWAYEELRRSGVHFPQRSGDSAPVFTPPVTHPVPRQHPAEYGMPINSSMRLDEAMASEIGNLSLSDLDSIQRVTELLDDMLQALNATDHEAIKDEVILDLINQCRSNQKKIIHLVSSTRDEELLSRSLELNDNLQYLIAKHDAIASGSPLPIKSSDSIPRSYVPLTPGVETEQVRDEEEEEEEDGFAQLACRKSKNKSDPSQISSSGKADQGATSNMSDVTTEAMPTSRTETSSSPNHALALSDQPNPASTVSKNKEQDIIDLLSITLSTNTSPPHTPVIPSPTSTDSEPTVPHSNTPEYNYNPQQFPVNQGYMTYNNYVAPWAQQTLPQPGWQQPPQYAQYASSLPPPPWATSSTSDANNPASTTHQQSTPQGNMAAGYAPSMIPSRPLMKYNSFSSAANTPVTSVPLQHHGLFGSSGNSNQVMVRETQQNVNMKPSGSAAASKPFIPSYRLFEDLVDLRSADGGLKAKNNISSASGSSNQSMVNSKK